MKHKRYQAQLADYVLGLLDSAEITPLESHLATCPDCRAALTQERAVLQAVRRTVSALPMPTHARLLQLRPAPPTRQPKTSWQGVVAFAAAITALIAGNLGFQLNHHAITATASPLPANAIITATMTPTVTHVATQFAYSASRPTAIPTP